MNSSLSFRAVLRRTFGIYTGQAPRLLMAALLVAAIVALDQTRFGLIPALAIAAILINALALGLFVCVVVLVAAEVWEGGAPRNDRMPFSDLGR